jgi:hypothetical protein
MQRRLTAVLVGTAATFAAAHAAAHHSFAAEFDANAPIELTGYVTKIEWANPHTFFYIDVKNEKGAYENWALEMGSPNGLMRRGWTRNTLKIGDVVTVTGSRAKDGSFKGNARSVVLSTGQRLFAGSSQPGAENDGT